MQRDGWQLPYHSCFFAKMKYSCRLCGVGGAWWELFTNGEEGRALRFPEMRTRVHHSTITHNATDSFANVLLLFKSQFSSFCSILQHQGHIHTKKHLSKMAGACRPSLNRDSEEHEQRPWDDLLFDYTQRRQTSKKALLTASADVTAAVMMAEAVKNAPNTAAATPPIELASPVTTMALVPARPVIRPALVPPRQLAQQMAVVPARQVAVVPMVPTVPTRQVLLRSRSRRSRPRRSPRRSRSRLRSRQRRSRTRSRSRQRRSPSSSSTSRQPSRRRKRRQRRQRRRSTSSSSSSSTSSRRSRRTPRRKNRHSVP